MSTGDFWDDIQSVFDPEELNARVGDSLSQLDGSTESAVSLLTGIAPERLTELGGFKKDPTACPSCGGRVHRWWADADGDGDVERRAQCDHCEWEY